MSNRILYPSYVSLDRFIDVDRLRGPDGDLRDRLQRRMKEEEDGNFYPQYHGGDATGELAWSIRMDGRFTDAFRALMPAMPANPASRPALWAARR